MTSPISCDLCIVGGGLAGGLTALAIAQRRPDIDVLLVEGAETLGGNHVWSWFDSDLSVEGRAMLAPMTTARWQGHDVRFPGYDRTLSGCYNSMASERFDVHMHETLGDRALMGSAANRIDPDGITLADGRRIVAGGVIDARGGGDLSALSCGWQKFMGRELRLTAPHGLSRPVIMDTTVDQSEGYRFVYLLPFGERDVFVEDTYYSDTPGLDLPELERRIDAYAAAQGWTVEAVLRHETGVLPVLMGGDFDAFWPASDPIPRAGARGGLFHPTTGYSLPDAVDFALSLCRLNNFSTPALARFSRDRSAAAWKNRGYYRLLDSMLFRAAPPAERWRIFDRFYRLSEPLIARFYAARSTAFDKARILCGKPPVPIRAAINAIINTKKSGSHQ